MCGGRRRCVAVLTFRSLYDVGTAPEDFTQRSEEGGGGRRGQKKIKGVRIPLPLPSDLCALLCPPPSSVVFSSGLLPRQPFTVALQRHCTAHIPPYLTPWKAPHLLNHLAPPISPNIDSPLASSSLSPSTSSQRRRKVAPRAEPHKPRPPESRSPGSSSGLSPLQADPPSWRACSISSRGSSSPQTRPRPGARRSRPGPGPRTVSPTPRSSSTAASARVVRPPPSAPGVNVKRKMKRPTKPRWLNEHRLAAPSHAQGPALP